MPLPPCQLRLPVWLNHDAEKRPYQPDGKPASTTDPKTWTSFVKCKKAVIDGRFSGCGMALREEVCGIDLDGVRDPLTGQIEDWARDIVLELDSYAEISPSGTGIHIICKGELPGPGFNAKPVEMYGPGRYFTMTGDTLPGYEEIKESPTLPNVYARYKPKPSTFEKSVSVFSKEGSEVEQCRNRLYELPDAVSGEKGHDKCLRAACEILRFGLAGPEGFSLLIDFNNDKCLPPFTEKELKHKWRSAKDKVLVSGEFGKYKSKNKPFSFDWVNDTEFLAHKYEQKYLVEGVIAANQHLVIGAPPKTLKTSIALDLLLSLASGTPFLGHFPVPEAVPVLFVSGESGAGPLQNLRCRIADSRGIGDTQDNFHWSFNIPQLSVQQHMDLLTEKILMTDAKLCVVDPAYLATLERGQGSSSDVFTMGSILRDFGNIGIQTGCTMSLIHHLTKAASARKPADFAIKPTIADLSQAGFAEFCRQWLMLNRQAFFAGGWHKLWLIVGGSAGHYGEYTLEVNEGVPDIVGRKWEVSVTETSASGPIMFDAAAYEMRKDQIMTAIRGASSGGLSMNAIKKITKHSPALLRETLEQLIALGQIRKEIKKLRGIDREIFSIGGVADGVE